MDLPKVSCVPKNINLFHVLVVAPFLAFIAGAHLDPERFGMPQKWMYQAMALAAVLIFAYHGYQYYQKSQ